MSVLLEEPLLAETADPTAGEACSLDHYLTLPDHTMDARIAAARAFNDCAATSNPRFYPYGIYTIPEISFIGKNEEQLTSEDVPYEVGMAYYRETARGQILGDTTGRLKLIFHRDTRAVLGVHIIGEDASELVHIGQAVMVLGGTVNYFIENVFNYPTLAECYKVAAFNGLGRLHRYQAE